MADNDQRLADLLNRLEEERRAGRAPSVDTLARENPDLAQELRQLWAVAQVAQVAAGSGDPDATLPPALRYDPPSSGTLPRTFGDYELLQELGRGGMGIVYKARQK